MSKLSDQEIKRKLACRPTNQAVERQIARIDREYISLTRHYNDNFRTIQFRLNVIVIMYFILVAYLLINSLFI